MINRAIVISFFFILLLSGITFYIDDHRVKSKPTQITSNKQEDMFDFSFIKKLKKEHQQGIIQLLFEQNLDYIANMISEDNGFLKNIQQKMKTEDWKGLYSLLKKKDQSFDQVKLRCLKKLGHKEVELRNLIKNRLVEGLYMRTFMADFLNLDCRQKELQDNLKQFHLKRMNFLERCCAMVNGINIFFDIDFPWQYPQLQKIKPIDEAHLSEIYNNSSPQNARQAFRLLQKLLPGFPISQHRAILFYFKTRIKENFKSNKETAWSLSRINFLLLNIFKKTPSNFNQIYSEQFNLCSIHFKDQLETLEALKGEKKIYSVRNTDKPQVKLNQLLISGKWTTAIKKMTFLCRKQPEEISRKFLKKLVLLIEAYQTFVIGFDESLVKKVTELNPLESFLNLKPKQPNRMNLKAMISFFKALRLLKQQRIKKAGLLFENISTHFDNSFLNDFNPVLDQSKDPNIKIINEVNGNG